MEISHNTPCLSPKFCIIFVADFSWGVLQSSQQKLKTMLIYFFYLGGGGGEGGANKEN